MAYLFGAGPKKFDMDLQKLDDKVSIDIQVDKNQKIGEKLTLKVSILSQIDQKVRYLGGLYSSICIDKVSIKKKGLIARYTDVIDLKAGDVQVLILSWRNKILEKCKVSEISPYRFCIRIKTYPTEDLSSCIITPRKINLHACVHALN